MVANNFDPNKPVIPVNPDIVNPDKPNLPGVGPTINDPKNGVLAAAAVDFPLNSIEFNDTAKLLQILTTPAASDIPARTPNPINGIRGRSQDHIGVIGRSVNFVGVWGRGEPVGVVGISNSGDGVYGNGIRGVVGESETFQGVYGISHDNAGVVGESATFDAVFGISHSPIHAGTSGTNDKGGLGVVGISDAGIGILGKGGLLAGRFEGDVEVTGDIRLVNADCAEDFDIADVNCAEPGTVMVLGDEGQLFPSQRPYDKRVAGVISGAGEYKPGIVLDKRETEHQRQPVALLGKVFCKVDAQYGSVEVGDLLTTSATLGHAMKVSEPLQAFGTVIGKALRPLKEGQALIPILIALQ
jgi:hypothetical protein